MLETSIMKELKVETHDHVSSIHSKSPHGFQESGQVHRDEPVIREFTVISKRKSRKLLSKLKLLLK